MYTEDSSYEGSSGFVAGMLAGVTVGLGLGMLFAPRAGADIRRTIAGQASDLKQATADTYKQASSKVRDIVDRGRDQAHEAVRTAQDAMREAADDVETDYGQTGASSSSIASNLGGGAREGFRG
jgi:gas vesicle protein